MDQSRKIETITLAVLILGVMAALLVKNLGGGVALATAAAFAASSMFSLALRPAIGRWFNAVVRPDEEFLSAYREHVTRFPRTMVIIVLLTIAIGIGGFVLTSPFLSASAGALLGTSTILFVVKSEVESGTI